MADAIPVGQEVKKKVDPTVKHREGITPVPETGKVDYSKPVEIREGHFRQDH